VSFLGVNAVLYVVFPTDGDWQMAIWGGIAFVVVAMWHWFIRRTADLESNVGHFIANHIDITSSILFAFFALSGLALRFYGNADYGLYTPFHTAWHGESFIALYFFLRIFDPAGAWVWKRMDPCDVKYHVPAVDESYEEECENISVAVLTGSL
jgi:hypothetical protein